MKKHDPHTILVNQIEYLKKRKKVELYILKDEFQFTYKYNSPSSVLKELFLGITYKIDFKELIFNYVLKMAPKTWFQKSDLEQPQSFLKSSLNFAMQIAISKLKTSKFGKKHATLLEYLQSLIPAI
jgi:hypothetical protein